MKRREILKLIAPALLLGACKNEKFTLPTIVTGKVTYEDGSPVEGAELRFSGKKRVGVSASPVFGETLYTDEAGMYSVSYVIPKQSDIVMINMIEGSIEEPRPADEYNVYIFVDEAYRFGMSYDIPYSRYGKTTTVDYQLRKK